MIKTDDIAYLQYTSGSTGNPKGVKVSHRNLLSNLSLVFETIDIAENERMVSWLPPYHDMGLIGNILFPVFAHYPILMMSPVNFLRHPFFWLKAISDFKASISGGPNFSYELCTKKIEPESLRYGLDLSRWRVAYNGAEHIHHNTLENFYNKFSCYGFQKTAYYPIYGLAESTVYVSGFKEKKDVPRYVYVEKQALHENRITLCDANAHHSQVLVGCGKPMVDLMIVDCKSGQICQDGQIGEIWLQGDSVALGYWHKEQETKETFEATIPGSASTPYLKTGDLGFILHDHLYITGRIKDLIIINGKNHYPQDIEMIVQTCDGRIRPGCCVAFSLEKDNQEKLGLVCEVKKSPSLAECIDICNKIVLAVRSNYGLEVDFILLIPPKTLPKTTSGKLRRNDTKIQVMESKLPFLYEWYADKECYRASKTS